MLIVFSIQELINSNIVSCKSTYKSYDYMYLDDNFSICPMQARIRYSTMQNSSMPFIFDGISPTMAAVVAAGRDTRVYGSLLFSFSKLL